MFKALSIRQAIYLEGQFIRVATKSEIWYLPMEANIDLSKISPTLFLDFTAQSLTYLLKPCKEAGLIEEIINAGNGAIVNEVGLYTITLMSPNEDYDGDEEVFSTKYIADCARENKQLNLNNYRLNKRSRFRPAFDVNDVQDKRLNWVTAEASWSRVEGGPQNANTNNAVPNKVPPRTLYTHNEKKAIVKYIVKNNGIDRVKGRALWEEMEEELKIGRTWQSMKEHFIKSIVPNIDSFKISANDKCMLKSLFKK